MGLRRTLTALASVDGASLASVDGVGGVTCVGGVF
jgi:hypothetical protein